MGFADWKKKSKLFRDFEARWAHVSCVEIAQAAYKAGERDGRKQVEAIAANSVELAVLVEREECAKTCEALELVFDCQSAQPGYWPDQIAHKCGATIRMRSNGGGNGRAGIIGTSGLID